MSVEYWFVVAAGLAMLLPVGLILIAAAGLDSKRAWDVALGGLAALALAGLGYWAVGFALQFGGIGLLYPQPGLLGLVWEWSALPPDWGTGWGMAGLSGWFLSSDIATPEVYALFLGHLPWAMTAALLPTVALRGRAPALASLLIALLTGGLVYPLAGNWVQGGGWLAALGRNLGLGHGFVDFAGAGTVFLVASSFTLAALLAWLPRQEPRPLDDPELPPAQLPLLAVAGALLLFTGAVGWSWSNPIQTAGLEATASLRGGINLLLAGGGGVLVPLLYTWFVVGHSHPLMSARGVAAGIVAGLAVGPFVLPGTALLLGMVVGASVPLVTFGVDRLLRLNDRAGVMSMAGIPAALGLLAVGLWADGSLGAGWQLTGLESHLGVAGQGVSGLFVASGYQPDFPGQLQAQLIGLVALALWGFVTGAAVNVPLSVMFHGLEAAASAQIPVGMAGPAQLIQEPESQAGQPGPLETPRGDESLVHET